jgi:hypothetical protein
MQQEAIEVGKSLFVLTPLLRITFADGRHSPRGNE